MPAYDFKQTVTEVTVTVPVPPNTRAKMVKVDITKSKISAALASGELLIQGDLFKPIKDSVWSVVDQKELVITLEKTIHEWWPHVVTTDPKIDVTKLEPERSSLGDLDGETRATVEKMMFDQKQKLQGQPTSDEIQRSNTLENFKKQHPELDFSQLKSENINYRG